MGLYRSMFILPPKKIEANLTLVTLDSSLVKSLVCVLKIKERYNVNITPTRATETHLNNFSLKKCLMDLKNVNVKCETIIMNHPINTLKWSITVFNFNVFSIYTYTVVNS